MVKEKSGVSKNRHYELIILSLYLLKSIKKWTWEVQITEIPPILQRFWDLEKNSVFLKWIICLENIFLELSTLF